MKPPRTLFVIADGGRARFVERSQTADDFVTVRELLAAPDTRAEPDGVAFSGKAGQRFNVGEKNAAVQQHRLRFAEDVAGAINAEATVGRIGRLAVVAPPRMLAAIRKQLCKEAESRLARTLGKDLTKTPDHELGAWLHPLERG